jgi:hypothetical protein
MLRHSGTAAGRIQVTVVLVDEHRNNVCNTHMSPAECPYTEEGLAVSLTLVQEAFFNYSAPWREGDRVARTQIQPLQFSEGTLRAEFGDFHVPRVDSNLRLNVSLLQLPVELDEEGVPTQTSRLPTVQSDYFKTVDGGLPASLLLSSSPPRSLRAGSAWDSKTLLQAIDVYGDLCSEFNGQVQLSLLINH